MTISVELLDPRHDAQPQDLEDFVAQEDLHPYWSYDMLRIASWYSWSPVLLGVIRVSGEVVGVVCSVWVMPHRGTFAPTYGGPVPRLLDVRQPGNGYTPPWHFTAGIAEIDRVQMMRAFERAAMRRLGPTCAGVVFRQALTTDLPMLRDRHRLVPRKVLKSVGTTILDTPWSTYDGWLGSLSKSRRGDLRRQSRRVREDPELTIRFDFGRVDIDTEAAARLLSAHILRLNNGQMSRPLPTPTLLRHLTTRKDIGVLTYTDGTGRLIGYGTLMVGSSSVFIGQWGAIRPEDGGRRHIYFDMYCRFIEWAIDNGRRSINAGRGMIDVKQQLGFREQPMFVVIAPRWFS
jgi:uncharacterized protein